MGCVYSLMDLLLCSLRSIHQLIMLLSRLAPFQTILVIVGQQLLKNFNKCQNIVLLNRYWWFDSQSIIETYSYNHVLFLQPLNNFS